MPEVAGRRQSRFAEFLAKRTKGDAIVSNGQKERGYRGGEEVQKTLLECS